GVCMTPVNEVTSEGLPSFYIRDIPPISRQGFEIVRPEIYFGERTDSYILVNTDQQEFDFPRGDRNVYTNYSGSGGIVLDSIFKRFIYAVKFSDLKILISTLIKPESRLLYDRSIMQIVSKIAPFIAFDRDPYVVVTESGRMVWMLDGYTVSDRFPYSEPFQRGGLNYIRNSVKVTVDAYNGATNFYVADKKDPIIQTLSAIYSGMFKSFDRMPLELKTHIRYPKDLFSVQANMFRTYHMTDTQVFYNREDLWAIPQETYEESEQTMEAYYMVTRLPQEKKDSFILLLPFTPTNKHNMISWLSAKCDLDDYGKLNVYKFPKKRMIYGPMQIESRIDQDTEISQKLTLWGQVGSRVIRGNLMVVPIEDSLIYVEPIYLQATQSKLPELKRTIFAYDDKIVMGKDLDDAISKLFDEKRDEKRSELDSQEELFHGSRDTLSSLVDRLIGEYSNMKKALKETNWSEFGKKMTRVDKLFTRLSATQDKAQPSPVSK
ncbi:MAG: uncharacterized membrane protein (UPF0182 family), partial [Candidatus Marinamargulisbacteria bacterium]